MPAFFCVVVALCFVIKIVQARELVQHAITQAAVEIAETAYIYDMIGLLEAQRAVEGVVDGVKSKASEAVNNAFDMDSLEAFGVNVDPGGEVSGAIGFFAGKVHGAVFGEFVKNAAAKYIAGMPSAEGADAREEASAALRLLGVEDGLDGMEFAGSSFLADGGDDVVVTVEYRMDGPPFLEAITPLVMRQQACARAWVFGERRPEKEAQEEEGGEDEEDDSVWSKPPMERGKAIGKVFGANLPPTFPGINAFKDGEAVSIKSVDTTSESYQEPSRLKAAIMGHVKKVEAYAGQPKPWGGERKITIMPEEIQSRRLILVIPENGIPANLEAAIAACQAYAESKGVVFELRRYQAKKIVKEGEGLAPEP